MYVGKTPASKDREWLNRWFKDFAYLRESIGEKERDKEREHEMGRRRGRRRNRFPVMKGDQCGAQS